MKCFTSLVLMCCVVLSVASSSEAKGRRGFSACVHQSFASVAPEVSTYEKPSPANEVALNVNVNAPAGGNDWLIKHPTILKLVELTNKQRASMGVGPVALDEQMCLDAQRHAQWMATQGGFQHSGLPYLEIIHQSVTTPESAVSGWVNSPPHHGIMLSGSRVGFGYAVSAGGYPYWVGVFR